MQFDIYTTIAASILALLIVIILIRRFIVIREYHKSMGNTHTDPKKEWLLGKTGIVREKINPEKPGRVFVQGASWQACTESGTYEPGEEVRITGFSNHNLIVSSVETSDR